MTTYYLNGKALTEGANVTLNGMTYPYSWLESAPVSIRASYGIEKIGDVNYDLRYYNGKDLPKPLDDREEVDENGDPLFERTWIQNEDGTGQYEYSDKRVVANGLKTTCLDEIKSITGNLLKPTDYYIIRNNVEGLEIPESVSTYRASVVTESARLQEAISAVTSVEQLIQLMNSVSWPEQQ